MTFSAMIDRQVNTHRSTASDFQFDGTLSWRGLCRHFTQKSAAIWR